MIEPIKAGGVTVPVEAVEASARADHAFGRLNFSDDPDWDDLSDADRDSYRQANRAALTAAAPLIVEHYLRERVEAVSVPDDGVAPWVHDRTAAKIAATATRDALNVITREVIGVSNANDPFLADALDQERISFGKVRAALNERADELERGADR